MKDAYKLTIVIVFMAFMVAYIDMLITHAEELRCQDSIQQILEQTPNNVTPETIKLICNR